MPISKKQTLTQFYLWNINSAINPFCHVVFTVCKEQRPSQDHLEKCTCKNSPGVSDWEMSSSWWALDNHFEGQVPGNQGLPKTRSCLCGISRCALPRVCRIGIHPWESISHGRGVLGARLRTQTFVAKRSSREQRKEGCRPQKGWISPNNYAVPLRISAQPKLTLNTSR